MDYYNGSIDTIHLKFGDMRKHVNFTEKFSRKYPKFVEEYFKYLQRDPECKFGSALEIVNYVDYYNIPVHFYFNYTDTPAKNNKEVQDYLVREAMPRDYGDYKDGKMLSWDGHPERQDDEHNS